MHVNTNTNTNDACTSAPSLKEPSAMAPAAQPPKVAPGFVLRGQFGNYQCFLQIDYVQPTCMIL